MIITFSIFFPTFICVFLYLIRRFFSQRAFADAHRALVASLDWDSAGDGVGQHHDLQEGCSYFPLLQCLLLWN